jgi:hypothetical protein
MLARRPGATGGHAEFELAAPTPAPAKKRAPAPAPKKAAVKGKKR